MSNTVTDLAGDLLTFLYDRKDAEKINDEEMEFAKDLAEKLSDAGMGDTAEALTEEIEDGKLQAYSNVDKRVFETFIEESRDNGELKVSSAFAHYTEASQRFSGGGSNDPVKDFEKLLTRQDGDLGISGNVARDLHTFMKETALSNKESDHVDGEMFRYAWDLIGAAREQGFDETADALEKALQDGSVSSDSDGGGESNKIMKAFAAETREAGNENTADAFEDDLENGELSWNEYHDGADAVEADAEKKTLGQKGEDALDAIATHYAEGGIKVDDRKLTSFKSDAIRPHFEALVERYRDSNPGKWAQDAADWIIGQITERLDSILGDDGYLPEDKDALSIFKNYVGNDDRNGQTYALDIARSVYAED